MISWLLILVFTFFTFLIHDRIKEKKIVYFFWVIVFSILSGFRFGFPSDYFQYKEIYDSFYVFQRTLTTAEFGVFYNWFFHASRFLHFDIQLIYFISFLWFFIPFSIFLYRYSKNIYVSISLFLFVGQAYIRSVGNIRNSVAIGIILIGMILWLEKENRKHLIAATILFAALFVHISVIILIPIIYLMDVSLGTMTRKLIFVGFLIVSLFSLDIMKYVTNNIGLLNKYTWYFSYSDFKLTNFIIVSRSVKLLVGYVILSDSVFHSNIKGIDKKIVNLYLINIYLSAFTYFIPIWPLERISQPLMIFELLTIALFFNFKFQNISKLKINVKFTSAIVLYYSWAVFSFLYLSIDAYPYKFMFKLFHD